MVSYVVSNSFIDASSGHAGGELFEHILAHRSLKEKDAKRLFAQLVSSVHYMHQKRIVHRDLKLVRRCIFHQLEVDMA